MINGGKIVNQSRTLNRLKILPFFNNKINRSEYYRLRTYENNPYTNSRINTSTNFNQSFPYSHLNYSYRNNLSLFDLYKNNNVNHSFRDILSDLRETLKNTEKIINQSKSFRLKRTSNPLKINNKNKNQHIKNKMKSVSVKNLSNKNKLNKKNEKEKENKNIENELKYQRSKLMKSNIDIRKENMILEFEINNYKKQIYSRRMNRNAKIYIPLINENYRNYKTILKSSIDANTKKIDQIFKLFKINEDLYNEIINNSSPHKHNFKKVENYYREKAEIQIMNKENEKKYKNLKKENILLLKKREKLEVYLEDLKNKGNNYDMIFDSNNEKIKVTKELINKLYNSKNILEEKLNKITEKINNNAKIVDNNNRKIISYNNKLNNLNLDVNKCESLKRRLIQKNIQLEKEKMKMDNINNSKENIIKIKLLNEYNLNKSIYNRKMRQIKQKEEEIEILKKYIDNLNYTDNFSSINTIAGLNEVMNDGYLHQNIESIINENRMIGITIHNVFNIFDAQINQKDKIIKNYQNQLLLKQRLKNQKNQNLNTNKYYINNNSNNNLIKNTSKNKVNKIYKYNISDIENENKNEQIINKKLNKNLNRDLIYNRLNNINDPNYHNDIINNDKVEKIRNKKNKSEINSDYFSSRKENSNMNEKSVFQTDDGKTTDLDEIIKKNNEINAKFGKKDNLLINSKNNAKKNLVTKETDDLGEIADQINQYKQSSLKQNNNENGGLNNNNPINNSQNNRQENEEYELDEKQLNHLNSEDNEKEPLEENEINEDNLNDLNDEQNILNNDINNEDIYNPENGENNNDYNYFLYKNMLKEQAKEREEEVVDESMDVIEGEDNFFDNINDINNEYEIYNENQNQEEEEEKRNNI